MKITKFPEFNRNVCHTTIQNGLDITMIPMIGFNKTYAVLTVDYGSVDNKINGQKVPDGIAHFLEHKMFEKADHDAFDLFGKYGADSNAFTGFTQTSYQFSTSTNLKENIETLLDFVQSPYFTQASVQKEQGIIGQEIQMYADNPSSRLYTGTLGNMYPNDPLHVDITGSIDSIREITPELLYDCYHYYYQPQNMRLVLAGNLDPQKCLEWINDNQEKKRFPKSDQISHFTKLFSPGAKDIISSTKIKMPISRPKVMVGIRGIQTFKDSVARLRYKVSVELLLEMLFDDITDNFLKLYDNEVIDDSFGFSFEMERGFHFATISSETEQVNTFVQAIYQILDRAKHDLALMEKEFTNVKKASLGRMIAGLNSPELIANRFSTSYFDDLTIFNEIDILKSLDLSNLQSALHDFIEPKRIVNFQIEPQHS